MRLRDVGQQSDHYDRYRDLAQLPPFAHLVEHGAMKFDNRSGIQFRTEAIRAATSVQVGED